MGPGELPTIMTRRPSENDTDAQIDAAAEEIYYEDAEPEPDSPDQLRIFDEFNPVSSITEKSLEDVFTPHYADPSGEGIHGSFEFGDGNGHTACLGTDFDLIQLTAPATDQCGMVFVRGNMPDDPVSILSRAQRQGFGFGFRVPEDVDYRWSDYLPKNKNTLTNKRKRMFSGYLNHRWPVVKERILDHNGNLPLADIITAYCYNGGRMIQVSKISQANYHGLSDPKRAQESSSGGEIELKIKLGDIVRLGCCCTGCPQPGDSKLSKEYNHEKKVEEGEKRLLISDCDPNSQTQLSIQWFEDGKLQKIGNSKPRSLGSLGGVDACYHSTIKIGANPKILVTIFTLQSSGDEEPGFLEFPTMERVEDWLGLPRKSPNNWTRAWDAVFPADVCSTATENHEEFKSKICLIAHTTEYILSVSSVRFRLATSDENRPHEVALVSNIVSGMRVDVQTAFWQVRLLVTIYSLFQLHLRFLPDGDDLRPLLKAYSDRILVVLEGVTWWMQYRMETLTSQESYAQQFYYINGNPTCPDNSCGVGKSLQSMVLALLAMPLIPTEERPAVDDADPDADGGLSYFSTPAAASHAVYWGFYLPLTLFYISLFTHKTGPEVEKMHEWISLTCRKRRKLSLVQKGHKRTGRESSSGALINAFLRLFDAQYVLWVEYTRPLGTLDPDLNQNKKIAKSLRKELDERWSEEKEKRSKLRPDIYSPWNELADRLALLFEEIFQKIDECNRETPSAEKPSPKVIDVDEFLMRRSLTQKIRAPRPVDVRISLPFVSVKLKEKSTFYGGDSHWIPWEVSCVSYATSTQCEWQMNRYEEDHEFHFDIYRRFLLPSFSIIPSWDDPSETTIVNWWHVEPGCLLAVSLTDAFVSLLLNYADHLRPKEEDIPVQVAPPDYYSPSLNPVAISEEHTRTHAVTKPVNGDQSLQLAKEESSMEPGQFSPKRPPESYNQLVAPQNEEPDLINRLPSESVVEPAILAFASVSEHPKEYTQHEKPSLNSAMKGSSSRNLPTGDSARETVSSSPPRSPPPSARSSRSVSPMNLSSQNAPQQPSGVLPRRSRDSFHERETGIDPRASSRSGRFTAEKSADLRRAQRQRSQSLRNGIPRSVHNLPSALKKNTGLTRARTWSPLSPLESSIHDIDKLPRDRVSQDYMTDDGIYQDPAYINSSSIRQDESLLIKSVLRLGPGDKSTEYTANSDYAPSSRTAFPDRNASGSRKVHFNEPGGNDAHLLDPYCAPLKQPGDIPLHTRVNFRQPSTSDAFTSDYNIQIDNRSTHQPASSYSEETSHVHNNIRREDGSSRRSISNARSEARMSEDGTEYQSDSKKLREASGTEEFYEDILNRSCSVLYYPDHMVASVEDTPDLYDMKLRDRLVPRKIISRIHAVFEKLGMLPNSGGLIWSQDEIAKLVKTKDIKIVDYDSQCRPTMLNGPNVHKQVLVNHIMDNRVDLDARYRIIAAAVCMPDTARILMYLLHGESLSAIDNYYSGNNHLTDTEKSLDLTLALSWSTSLTFTYPVLSTGEGISDVHRQELHRTHGQFPPKGLLKHFKLDSNLTGGDNQSLQRNMTLLSMTFVITGDTIGRTWTCTLLGKPLALYASGEKDVYLEEIRFIISSFAYDAVASRCLVTMILTGHMMYEMSEAYNEVIAFLDCVLHVSDASSIFGGLTEEDAHNVSNILAYGWVIDALGQFDENIRDALRKADYMEYQMLVRMDHSRKYWSPALMEIFDQMVYKQYTQRMKTLVDTHLTIIRRSRKFESYRSGVSNLISLQEAKQATKQSSEAVAQGSNIMILTLITITYLPLSLTTSIFGMDIMPKSASFATFGWVMAVSCAVTFISVFNLKRSRDWIGQVWEEVKQNLSGSPSPALPQKDDALTKRSNWTYLVPLIRLCLVTYPVREIKTFRSSKTTRASPTDNPIPTVSQPGQPGMDNQNMVGTIAPVRNSTASSAPPRDSLWQDHLTTCKACKKSTKFEICGIGKKLVQQEVASFRLPPQSHLDPNKYALPQNLPTDPRISSKSIIMIKDYETGVTSKIRASGEHSRPGSRISQNNTPSLSIVNQEPKPAMKGWVSSLASGLRMVSRKALLPVWLFLAVIDYFAILIFRNLSRIFVTIQIRGKILPADVPVSTAADPKGALEVIKAVFAEPFYIITESDPVRDGKETHMPAGTIAGQHEDSVRGGKDGCKVRISSDMPVGLQSVFKS